MLGLCWRVSRLGPSGDPEMERFFQAAPDVLVAPPHKRHVRTDVLVLLSLSWSPGEGNSHEITGLPGQRGRPPPVSERWPAPCTPCHCKIDGEVLVNIRKQEGQLLPGTRHAQV